MDANTIPTEEYNPTIYMADYNPKEPEAIAIDVVDEEDFTHPALTRMLAGEAPIGVDALQDWRDGDLHLTVVRIIFDNPALAVEQNDYVINIVQDSMMLRDLIRTIGKPVKAVMVATSILGH